MKADTIDAIEETLESARMYLSGKKQERLSWRLYWLGCVLEDLTDAVNMLEEDDDDRA